MNMTKNPIKKLNKIIEKMRKEYGSVDVVMGGVTIIRTMKNGSVILDYSPRKIATDSGAVTMMSPFCRVMTSLCGADRSIDKYAAEIREAFN